MLMLRTLLVYISFDFNANLYNLIYIPLRGLYHIKQLRLGYDTVFEAANRMGKLKDVVYTPNPQAAAVYDKLYAEYNILHDYFGRGANDVMKRLKAIKKEAAK